MARYIDAEKLMHALGIADECKKCTFCIGAICTNESDFVDACTAIAEAPTADVVEVVRCNECRHLEILNGQEYYARCKWHGRLFGSFGNADTRTWFCADGERRDDEEPT